MKMMKKSMALMTGAGMLGYMYLKKHPEKTEELRQKIKETSKKVYNMMDTE